MKTIKSKQDFEKVFSRGKRVNHPLVRVTVLKRGDDEEGRVAFVAAKRLGNAVFRNRCKRVLRAAALSCELPRKGYDLILFSTKATHDVSSTEVSKALEGTLKRAGV